jgi:iron complex transport system substrate-binding protein
LDSVKIPALSGRILPPPWWNSASPSSRYHKAMLRIVSLIASATEIVHALGLGEFQVGRSHECNYPPEVSRLPVCTRPTFPIGGDSREIDRQVKEKLRSAASLYEVFPDVLDALAPTHIVTQTQCRVCAVSADDVREALSRRVASRPEVIALEPNGLSEIWDGVRSVARACGVPERGEGLVESLTMRLAEIGGRVGDAGRPTVACIEWPEPLMAAGNWTPELVEIAGGRNLFGEAGKHSPWLQWEDLAAADPEGIVVAPCGYSLERTRAEMHWLSERAGWAALKAVKTGRVFLADGDQYLHRPGPRVVESAQLLAEMLHPEVFAPRMRGQAWERWG